MRPEGAVIGLGQLGRPQPGIPAVLVDADAADRFPLGPQLAKAISDAIDLFKEKFPSDWGECQNWPLQHGVGHIAAKLRAL